MCIRDRGGQLHIAALPPQKEKIEWLRQCLVTQARKAGVELHTSTTFKPEMLAPGEADAVVVATGARPLEEQVSGARAGQVVSAWDILQASPPATGLAVVVLGLSLIH